MANRGQGQRPNQHNFRTDPHRMKTQKWVNAHQYSYDGDDWGALDEFNEYDGYDPAAAAADAAAAAPSKPTGLRQPGQGLRMSTEAARNFSSPEQPSSAVAAPGLRRAPSFEAGDDKRYFSAGSGPPPPAPWSAGSGSDRPVQARSPPPANIAAAAAAAAASSSTSASQGFRTSTQSATSQQQTLPSSTYRSSQTSQPGSQPPRGTSTQGPPSSGSRPTSNLTDQSDRPASAARQTPTGIAATSVAVNPPGGARFPPRQSSLSSQTSESETYPRPFSSSMPKHEEIQEEEAPAKMGEAAESATRPFIRPADIYRRMEEEKEKERQSMDSNRPSMDTIDASSRPQLGRGPDSDRGLRPLETLPERKSEYGMEGIQVPSAPQHQRDASGATVGPPSLPQLSRFSVFGSDMWSSGLDQEDAPPLPTNQSAAVTTAATEPQPEASSLQHQPSQGYRTAVQHAFQQSGPGSTSTTRSTHGPQSPPNDSEISRSNTDSTAGISPIIGHTPSNGSAAKQGGPADSIDTISEEKVSPNFAEAHGTLQGPFQIPAELVGPYPGHTRNTSGTSSTPTVRPKISEKRGDSPARAPSVEPGETVREAETAQMAMATPVDDGSVPKLDTSRFSYREADLAREVNASPEAAPAGTSEALLDAQNEFLQAREENAGKDSKIGDQPSANARRNSGDSIASWASSTADAKNPGGDIEDAGSAEATTASADFAHPERPRLPGEWISTASAIRNEQKDGTPVDLPTASSNYDSPVFTKEEQPQQAPDLSANAPSHGPEEGGGSTASQAMAAVAGAGAAMAASIAVAAGLKNDDTKDDEKSLKKPAVPTVDVSSDTRRSSAVQESYESDRLRDEIERSLTPNEDSNTAAGSNNLAVSHLTPKDTQGEFPRQSTVSSLYPREYDSYWASGVGGGGGSGSVSPAGLTSRTVSQKKEEIPQPAVHAPAWDVDFSSPAQPSASKSGTSPQLGLLSKRFSWEDDVVNEPAPAAPPATDAEAAPYTQVVEAGIVKPQHQSDEAAPRESVASARTDDSTPKELPPQLGSSTAAGASDEAFAKRKSSLPLPPQPQSPIAGTTLESPKIRQPGDEFGSEAKPPQFKDIAAIKQPASRIETYQKTRNHFSGMDTGLTNWLTHMIESNPETAKPISGASVAAIPGSGGFSSSVRQRLPGAIGKLTTRSASGTTPQQQPYYQQYLDAAASQANSPNNSTGQTPSPIYAGDPSGAQKSPVQSKLMQSASAFGGKATHSAKGLFNKGRNRLKGGSTDKVPSPTDEPRAARSSSRNRWSNLRQSLPFGSSSAQKDESPTHRAHASNHSSRDMLPQAFAGDLARGTPTEPTNKVTAPDLAQSVPMEPRDNLIVSEPAYGTPAMPTNKVTGPAIEKETRGRSNIPVHPPLISMSTPISSEPLDLAVQRPFAHDTHGDAEASDAEEWHDAVQSNNEHVKRPMPAPITIVQDDIQTTRWGPPLAEDSRHPAEGQASTDVTGPNMKANETDEQLTPQAQDFGLLHSTGPLVSHSRTVSEVSRVSAISGPPVEEGASRVSSLRKSDVTESPPTQVTATERQVPTTALDYPVLEDLQQHQTSSSPYDADAAVNPVSPISPGPPAAFLSRLPDEQPQSGHSALETSSTNLPHGRGNLISDTKSKEAEMAYKYDSPDDFGRPGPPRQSYEQSRPRHSYQVRNPLINEQDFAPMPVPKNPYRRSEPLDYSGPNENTYNTTGQQPAQSRRPRPNPSQRSEGNQPIRTASAVQIRSIGPNRPTRVVTDPESTQQNRVKPQQPKRSSFFGGLFSSSSSPSGSPSNAKAGKDKEKGKRLSKSVRPSDTRPVSSTVEEGNKSRAPPTQRPNPYVIPPLNQQPQRGHTFPGPGPAGDAASIVTSYNTPRQPRLPNLERLSSDADHITPPSKLTSRSTPNTDKPLPPGGMTEREREREAHIAHLAGQRVFGNRASPFDPDDSPSEGYFYAPDSDQVSNRRSYSAFQPPRNPRYHSLGSPEGGHPRSYYTHQQLYGTPGTHEGEPSSRQR